MATSRRSLLKNTAATVAISALGGRIARAEADEVRIGVIYDLSGPFAAGGSVASSVGTQIAIDLVNERGGILGKYKIVPINADSQSKADVAINEVERLIGQEKVDIINGVYSSAHAVPLAAKVEAQKRILWITTAVATAVFKDKNLQYVFRAQIHSDQYGEAFAKFISENAKAKLGTEPGDVKVAIIHEDGPYGVGVGDASERFAKELGLQVVMREAIQPLHPISPRWSPNSSEQAPTLFPTPAIIPILRSFCVNHGKAACASRCSSGMERVTVNSINCEPPSARTSTISATSIQCLRSCSIPPHWLPVWVI